MAGDQPIKENPEGSQVLFLGWNGERKRIEVSHNGYRRNRDIGFSQRSSLRPGIDLYSHDSGAVASFAASMCSSKYSRSSWWTGTRLTTPLLFLEVDVRVPPAHPVIPGFHRDDGRHLANV